MFLLIRFNGGYRILATWQRWQLQWRRLRGLLPLRSLTYYCSNSNFSVAQSAIVNGRVPPTVQCSCQPFHLIAVDFWGFDLHKMGKMEKILGIPVSPAPLRHSEAPFHTLHLATKCQSSIKVICFNAHLSPPATHFTLLCISEWTDTDSGQRGVSGAVEWREGRRVNAAGIRGCGRVCRGSFSLAHVANHLHTLQ